MQCFLSDGASFPFHWKEEREREAMNNHSSAQKNDADEELLKVMWEIVWSCMKP